MRETPEPHKSPVAGFLATRTIFVTAHGIDLGLCACSRHVATPPFF